MSYKLKQYLFNKYGGFADSRIKKIEKCDRFKIDDQRPSDNIELFCGIFVTIVSDDRFVLFLSNNAPKTKAIRELVKSKSGTIKTNRGYTQMEVELNVGDISFLRKLSALTKSIIAPGKKYSDANWVWRARRISESLDKFVEILSKYQG